MKLIFIYGLPATGKLTVAQELSKITPFKLFHNHLVVDLLLSTFEFGSTPFVELREQIWISLFDHACRACLPGLIFTFNPETTVRPSFIERTVETITRHNGAVHFIELVCPIEELKQRIGNTSRLQYRKLNSVSLFSELLADGVFDTSHMPNPVLTIDTSMTAPRDAAQLISDRLELVNARNSIHSEPESAIVGSFHRDLQ